MLKFPYELAAYARSTFIVNNSVPQDTYILINDDQKLCNFALYYNAFFLLEIAKTPAFIYAHTTFLLDVH